MSYDAEGNYIDDGASISMADEAAAGNAQMDRFNENPNAANQYEAWVDSESAKASQGLDMAQQGRLDYAQTQTPEGQGAEKRADDYAASTKTYDEAYNTVKEYTGMMDNMLGLSKSAMTGGGAVIGDGKVKTGGEDSGFMSKLMDGILNPKNANLTNLGANFLAGMMNYKSKSGLANAQINSLNKNAEASMMNAQTAQAAQNLQEAGSKAMGLIHMPQAPIKYHNLLAERRARSGAK